MLNEMGFCKGIENYSRHLSGAQPGEPPPTLVDYLPPDALMFLEATKRLVMLPGFWDGDPARKPATVVRIAALNAPDPAVDRSLST